MHTNRDPEVLDVVQEQRHGEYGPSDTSDSASDVMGTASEATDSDANGTGERQSVEFIAPAQTEQDIPSDGAPNEVSIEGAEDEQEGDPDNLSDKDLEQLKSPKAP